MKTGIWNIYGTLQNKVNTGVEYEKYINIFPNTAQMSLCSVEMYIIFGQDVIASPSYHIVTDKRSENF